MNGSEGRPLTVSLRSVLQQEALPFVPLPLQELFDAGGHGGQRLAAAAASPGP